MVRYLKISTSALYRCVYLKLFAVGVHIIIKRRSALEFNWYATKLQFGWVKCIFMQLFAFNLIASLILSKDCVVKLCAKDMRIAIHFISGKHYFSRGKTNHRYLHASNSSECYKKYSHIRLVV